MMNSANYSTKGLFAVTGTYEKVKNPSKMHRRIMNKQKSGVAVQKWLFNIIYFTKSLKKAFLKSFIG